VEALRAIPDSSLDSCVTDPPYGIRFMGEAWDGADIAKRANERRKYSGDLDRSAGVRGGHKSAAAEAGKYKLSRSANVQFQEWTTEWAEEVLRVLKPGGHLLCFASTRTYHRMAVGVEDAGFEIRDQIGWVFGSGFPKSHNLRGEFSGWGTALKPAWEPIVVARKPLSFTVAENVGKYGTGALNISGCRIPGEPVPINRLESWSGFGQKTRPEYEQEISAIGRWPANLIHDGSDEVLEAFPDAPGQCGPVKYDENSRKNQNVYGAMKRGHEPSANNSYAAAGGTNFAMKPGARRNDKGSAARFFYVAKASREDRNEGCEEIDEKIGSPHWDPTSQRGKEHLENGWGVSRNNHPTVKPTDLMRYLCRLVTPTGGVVVDPFMGSGSTGKAALLEGFDFIGIDRDEKYCAIAKSRIDHVMRTDSPLFRRANL
jgi:DNA modification methylase